MDALSPANDEPPLVGGTVTPPVQSAQLVSMMDGFDFLKGTPLFRDLSLDEMKAFYNACEIRKFAPKETMIEQDKPGLALFVHV